MRGERGASLVEFAFVFPVLIILVFGMIDFGFAFNSYIELRSGAREGARLAAVNNSCSLTASGCSATADEERDDLIADTRAKITGLADPNDITIDVHFETTGAVGNNVQVCLVYPFESITGMFSWVNKDFKSKGIMRLEQTPTYSESTGVSGCS